MKEIKGGFVVILIFFAFLPSHIHLNEIFKKKGK
jgi:hypothetical protein